MSLSLDEKKQYLVKLLLWIWLQEESINSIAFEIDKKTNHELDNLITKLEQHYKNQNKIDQNFINKLNQISNKIDETIDNTTEKIQIENFNF